MFVFSHTFPVLWKSTFPMFWELYGFLCHPKYLRNPQLWNVYVFPHFSRTVEIHFPHVLGIIWISASPGIFKKSINLKCLSFPTFPVLWKSTFPMFWVLGIVWISASHKTYKKHLTLECSVFSYFSRTIGNHFPDVLGTMLLMWKLIKFPQKHLKKKL